MNKKYLKDCIDNHDNITGTKKEKLLKIAILKQHYEPFKLISVNTTIRIPDFVCDELFKIVDCKNSIVIDWSYNNDGEPDFYLPLVYNNQERFQNNETNVLNTDISLHYKKSINLYEKLLDDGIDKKQALLVLPRGSYKEVHCSITAYDFIKIYFILKNDGDSVSTELFDYMNAINKIFRDTFPKIYKCIIA